MYAITAIINRTGVDKTKGFPQGWESSLSLPTFYLDERTQGILGPGGAVEVARRIVLPLGETADMTASIAAVRVPGPDTSPTPAPSVDEAVLTVRFRDHTMSPALFLPSVESCESMNAADRVAAHQAWLRGGELAALEVTWDEDPVMVAAGRYQIEGTTTVLTALLERATWEGAVLEYEWSLVD